MRFAACLIALGVAVTSGCQSAAKLFEGTMHDAEFVFRHKWDLKEQEPLPPAPPANPAK